MCPLVSRTQPDSVGSRIRWKKTRRMRPGRWNIPRAKKSGRRRRGRRSRNEKFRHLERGRYSRWAGGSGKKRQRAVRANAFCVIQRRYRSVVTRSFTCGSLSLSAAAGGGGESSRQPTVAAAAAGKTDAAADQRTWAAQG